MKVTMTASVIVAMVLGSSQITHAQELPFTGYNCNVKNAYELSSGALVASKSAADYKTASFHIDRKTGKMSGSHGLSSLGWIGRNEVLDVGSDQQSYKAIYISPPYVHLRALLIDEYIPGPTKSFMFADDTDVLTGDCIHVR